MAELVVGIQGAQAKREADEIEARLKRLGTAAKVATGDIAGLATKGNASFRDIKQAASASADAIRKFGEQVTAGKMGERQMAAAASNLDRFRREIERVRATGGPVPQSWTRAIEVQSQAMERATAASGRNRAALEAQKRAAEDATRAAGGLGGSMGSVSEVLGLASNNMEKVALQAAAVYAATLALDQAFKQLHSITKDLVVSLGGSGAVVDSFADKILRLIHPVKLLGLVAGETRKMLEQLGAIDGPFAGITGGSSSRGGTSLAVAELGMQFQQLTRETDTFMTRIKALEVTGRATAEAMFENASAADSLVKRYRELGREVPKSLAALAAQNDEIGRTEKVAKAAAKALEEMSGASADAISRAARLDSYRSGDGGALKAAQGVQQVIVGLTADTAKLNEKTKEWTEGLHEAKIEIEDFDWQGYVEEPGVQAWQATKDAAVDALSAIIVGYEVDFEQLFKNVLQMWIRTLVEMVARARAAQLAVNAGGGGASGGGGGWMSAISGMFGGGGGGGAAAGGGTSTMAAVGWIAVAAGAVLAIAKWYRDRGDAEASVNLYQKTDGGLQYDYRNNPKGRDTIGSLQSAIQSVIKTAAQFIRELGGTLVPGSGAGSDLLSVGAHGRGKKINYWVKLANGIVENFGKDLDAAMEYAAIQAVKLAETKGLDPIVAAMIQASTAKKLADFQADIAAAQAVSRLGTSSASGLGEMDRLADLQRIMMQTLPHASAALADALLKIADASGKVWQAELNRLYGLPQLEDYTQRIADGEAMEAKRLQERARLLAAIAEQQASINAALAAGAPRGGAGGFGAGAGLWQGDDFTGRGGSGNNLPSMVDDAQNALDALFKQLAGLDEAIDFDKIRDGIKNDILGNLYQYLEGNKKYAAEILAWKRKELEMTFQQYKLQLMALAMWDEATQKIWQDALAAGLLSVKPRRGGSGNNRQDNEDGVKNALRDYGTSKLSGLTRALADVNQRWDDHAKAAGKNADLLRQIAAARQDEVNALVKQAQVSLRQDYRAFVGKDGGGVGRGMLAINKGADDLVDRARELRDLGKMGRAEFSRLRDAIREAAQEQRQSLVTDTANQMFLQMYDLLGKTEEGAQLRYDLTVAELEIKYKELEIAVAKYELEGGFLPGLRDLINQVRAGGPALFGGGQGSSGNFGGSDPIANTRDWWEETTRRWQQATLSLVDVLGGLALSELSPLSPEQRMAEARQQYETTLAQANAGDLTARESLGDIIRTYLQEAEGYYGRSTANYSNLFGQVQQQGLGVVANTWARGENGAMYNAAFGGGQMLQPVIDAITRSGLASATTSTQLYQQSQQQTAIMGIVAQQMSMLNAAFARFLAQQQAA